MGDYQLQNETVLPERGVYRLGAQISPFSGEFANAADETVYRHEIRHAAARQAQKGLIAAVIVLTFSFLPAFLNGEGASGSIATGFFKIALLAIVAILIFIPQTVKSVRVFQWLIVACAIAMAVTDARIVFSGEVAWQQYMLIVAIELVFFTLFIPNNFFQVVVSGLWIYGSFAVSGWQVAAEKLEFLLFSLALFIFAACCLSYSVGANRRARKNFYKTKAATASHEELEQYVLDLSSERQAVENAAAENVMLMEELTFTRQEAEEKSIFLKAVLENISQGVSVFDRNMNLMIWNKNFQDILDLPDNFLVVGRTMEDVIRFNAERGEYGESNVDNIVADRMARIKDRNAIESHHYERRRANGTYIEVRGDPMPGGGLVSTYTDVTERKKSEEIIRRMALQDPLTGLANRNHFNQKLTEKITMSRRDKCRVGLAMLDLDSFKAVNDTYGHPAGDALLKQVAGILTNVVREVDNVARLGGDEFAIIFHGIEERDAIDIPLARIIERLSQPMLVDGAEIQIGVSIGAGFIPDDAETRKTLIQVADQALYEAKNAGKGCFVKVGEAPVNITACEAEKEPV